MYVRTLLLSSNTPEKDNRPHYWWLWTTMWLLRIEHRTSGRTVSVLNHGAISPALQVDMLWLNMILPNLSVAVTYSATPVLKRLTCIEKWLLFTDRRLLISLRLNLACFYIIISDPIKVILFHSGSWIHLQQFPFVIMWKQVWIRVFVVHMRV